MFNNSKVVISFWEGQYCKAVHILKHYDLFLYFMHLSTIQSSYLHSILKHLNTTMSKGKAFQQMILKQLGILILKEKEGL